MWCGMMKLATCWSGCLATLNVMLSLCTISFSMFNCRMSRQKWKWWLIHTTWSHCQGIAEWSTNWGTGFRGINPYSDTFRTDFLCWALQMKLLIWCSCYIIFFSNISIFYFHLFPLYTGEGYHAVVMLMCCKVLQFVIYVFKHVITCHVLLIKK